ncbi:hypothetical protein OEV98_05980 [Caldibacillus lycopersici]|uniref:Uncharacterized protein n=1 Tax=Perspicuibacillus lycopersici TaxID=1325689 RepID=A0AAE3IT05_9BACI|nr:hypothetical protein [Perspicuibacillus lycopersici]MCU9613098.1 hypothetical protein [Perspicuibacillus lycopersici]
MNLLKLLLVIIIGIFLIRILLGILFGVALFLFTSIVIIVCFIIGWKIFIR